MADVYADSYADGYSGGDAIVTTTSTGTSAREIIISALKRANRLAPGETLDEELSSFCLDALNEVVEEMNGLGDVLWREIRTTSDPLTVGAVTVSATWPGLSPCVDIIAATYNNGALDVPMALLTMQQYTEQIWNKALTGNIDEKTGRPTPMSLEHWRQELLTNPEFGFHKTEKGQAQQEAVLGELHNLLHTPRKA